MRESHENCLKIKKYRKRGLSRDVTRVLVTWRVVIGCVQSYRRQLNNLGVMDDDDPFTI